MTTTVANRSLVALTPAELPAAQAELADWCLQKMKALGRDYRELRSNLAVATRNRWSRGGLVKAVNMTKKRILYYQKIRQAVHAGYLIIPNFPIEVMAVRVDRSYPPLKYGTYLSDVNEAKPDLLPPGQGRYVDETTKAEDLSHDVKQPDGSLKRMRRSEAGYFNDEVDFPTIAVKPVVMEATALAMSRKLFDRIGIAWKGGQTTSRTRRRSDPIVIGQILDPRPKGYGDPRLVSFFIAWFLNTADL